MWSEEYFCQSAICGVSQVLNQREDHLMANVTEENRSHSLEQTWNVPSEPLHLSFLEIEDAVVDYTGTIFRWPGKT